MKKILSIALVLLICTPSLAHALTISEIEQQIASYQEQIKRLQLQLAVLKQQEAPSTPPQTMNSGVSTAPLCQSERTLVQGLRGDDVKVVQEYLKTINLYGSESNGVYGPATEASVREWQKQQGIASNGSAGTTGWGAVGPKTRAALKAILCTPNAKPITQCSKVKEFLCAQPIVGSPRTYGSECALQLDGASLLYKGECRGTATTTPPTSNTGSSNSSSGQSTSGGSQTTTPAPTTTQTPLPTTDTSIGSVSPSCKTWSDGCNTCTRFAFGSGAAVCTLKACVNLDGINPAPTYQCLQSF